MGCNLNSDQQDNNLPQINVRIVRNFDQEIPTEMIVTSSGISERIAEGARASLDAQVAQLQSEGKLEPGKSSHEKLTWTPETIAAAQEFQKTVDLAPLKNLGVTAKQELNQRESTSACGGGRRRGRTSEATSRDGYVIFTTPKSPLFFRPPHDIYVVSGPAYC